MKLWKTNFVYKNCVIMLLVLMSGSLYLFDDYDVGYHFTFTCVRSYPFDNYYISPPIGVGVCFQGESLVKEVWFNLG